MIIFHEDSKNVDQKIYKLYYYYIKLIILYELKEMLVRESAIF